MSKTVVLLIAILLAVGGVAAYYGDEIMAALTWEDTPTGDVVKPTPQPEPTTTPDVTPDTTPDATPDTTPEPTPTPEVTPEPAEPIIHNKVFEYGEGVENELRRCGILDEFEKLYPSPEKLEIVYKDLNGDLGKGGTYEEVEILVDDEHLASYEWYQGIDLYEGIGGALDPEGFYKAAAARID